MKYAGIVENDVVNGEGVCVSFFMQGCPHRCKGCHNPETWNFDGGKEASLSEIIELVLNAIDANGIQRNLSILGGEPLAPRNQYPLSVLLWQVKKTFPSIKIYLWTGYTLEEFKEMCSMSENILQYIDVLIDGRYIEEERDITLKLRGSKNQRILYRGIDY